MAGSNVAIRTLLTEGTGGYKHVTGTRAGSRVYMDVANRGSVSSYNTATAWFAFANQSSPDYSDGDQLGSAVEITGLLDDAGGKGIIVGAMLIDADKIKPDLDIYLFESSPTVASSDNGAFDLSLTNAKLIQGVIPIRLGNWFVQNTVNVAFAPISGVSPFPTAQVVGAASSATSLYAQLVARGTLNFSSTTALTLKLLLLRL